jgi:dTDP-4-dehydrorhamnose 3,5-epimerase
VTTILTYTHQKIVTRDAEGEENGFLVPIFNVHDGLVAATQYPQQVYLTTVAPKSVKGPHLHLKRWGLFTCIKGNVRIILRTDQGYEEFWSGEDHAFRTVQVPAGIPAALQNTGEEAAYVLNMPAPAWRPEDQDEHAVTFDESAFRA